MITLFATNVTYAFPESDSALRHKKPQNNNRISSTTLAPP